MLPRNTIEHHGEDGAGHRVIGYAECLTGHGIVVFAQSVLESVGHRLVGDFGGQFLMAVGGQSGSDLVIGRGPVRPVSCSQHPPTRRGPLRQQFE